jgi:4-amino-4-deoxy-L-arabinose transferase-like glycosyltransferase
MADRTIISSRVEQASGRSSGSKLLRNLEEISPAVWVTVLCAVAFGLRLAWVLWAPTLPHSDFRWYYERALEIASSNRYGYPEPTVHFIFGYPLFLALIFKAFGPNLLAAKLTGVLLNTGVCALGYWIFRSCGGEIVGKIASALLAFYPTYIFTTSLLASEHLFTFLFLLALGVFLACRRRLPVFGSVIGGLILGLSALVRPQAILIPACIGIWIFIFWGKERYRRKFGIFSLVSLCALAGYSPWPIRNYLAFKTLYFGAGDGGHSFYYPNTYDGMRLAEELRMSQKPEGLAEIEMDRKFYRLGVQSVLREPGYVLKNIVVWKWRRFFGPDLSWVPGYNFARVSRAISHRNLIYNAVEYTCGFAYVLLFSLFVLGAIRRCKPAEDYLFILIVLCWIAIISVFHGAPRFNFPLVPIYAYFAASSIRAFMIWRLERLKL